jgi:hypothetical protein
MLERLKGNSVIARSTRILKAADHSAAFSLICLLTLSPRSDIPLYVSHGDHLTGIKVHQSDGG